MKLFIDDSQSKLTQFVLVPEPLLLPPAANSVATSQHIAKLRNLKGLRCLKTNYVSVCRNINVSKQIQTRSHVEPSANPLIRVAN
jgi:hypothetical protein